MKRKAAVAPAPGAGPKPIPVELPALETLGFDSDFTAFLRAEVDEKLKQAALSKLFHSPQFNRMDGLDVYIDDYNSFEPIAEEMLRELKHAQDLLFRDGDQNQADRPAGTPIAGVSGDEVPAELGASGLAKLAETDESPMRPISVSKGDDLE